MSSRARIAVALVLFALLAFTTVRTSPISSGFGPDSSLSKTTPKQRQLLNPDFVFTSLVFVQLAIAPRDFGNVVPAKLNNLPAHHFRGRYFSLPPPTA